MADARTPRDPSRPRPLDGAKDPAENVAYSERSAENVAYSERSAENVAYSERSAENGSIVETPESVVTKYMVAEVCTRMVVHADRREWELLGGLFADKVLLDYTSLGGGEPVSLAPQEIVDAWSATLGGYDSTQHLITNQLVDLTGDRAVCTAYFQATHRLAAAHGAPLWTLGGSYRWELARTGGRWLIDTIVMTAAWGDGNQELAARAVDRR